MAEYLPPVDQLLTLGEPGYGKAWRDYAQLGLGAEHVSDLIRMATDPELNRGDPDSSQVWAPVHAWRALGQLRAAAAVESLLQFVRKLDDDDESDDWAAADLPQVFGLIGPPALPALAALLADAGRGLYPGWTAADAVGRVAQEHPAARDECVGILTGRLERAEQNDPALNGVLIGCLTDLKAVEAAPVIERAFDAGLVDETIAGGWAHAQYGLGLSDKPPPRIDHFGRLGLGGPPGRPGHSAKAKAKARRQEARKARRRNRKRK